MPDFRNPAENDLIPTPGDDPGISDGAAENDLIPDDQKPPKTINDTFIFAQLQKNEMAQVGTILIQRKYRHEGTGGEFFSLLDTSTNREISSVELSDLAKVKTEKDLRAMFD